MKRILTTALASVVIASGAFATITTAPAVYVSGSTAFRKSVIRSIFDTINVSSCAWYTTGSSAGTTPFAANAGIYYGTIKTGAQAGQEVKIKTYWTGSASGVYDLAAGNALSVWMDDTMAVACSYTAGNPPTFTGGAGYSDSGTAYTKQSTSAAPIVALSDVAQSEAASAISSADTGGSAAASAINAAAFTNAGTNTAGHAGRVKTVGIVPFVWAKGAGAPAGISNITQQTAASLVANGFVPVSMFTGAAGDLTNYVILVGRNEDSGTRITSYAEAQNGIDALSPTGPNQFQLTFSTSTSSYTDPYPAPGGTLIQTGGSGGVANGAGLWPANWPLNTEANIYWANAGHSGYIAGSDVANTLKATDVLTGASLTSGAPTSGNFSSSSNVYVVGYAGVSDVATISSQWLTYNGVPYTVTALQNGQYTFFGFEHMYFKTGGLTTVPLAAVTNIADTIFSTDAPTQSNGTVDNTSTASAGVLFGGVDFTRSGIGLYLNQN